MFIILIPGLGHLIIYLCKSYHIIILVPGIDHPGGGGHNGQPPGPLHLQALPKQRHLGGPRPGVLRQASVNHDVHPQMNIS